MLWVSKRSNKGSQICYQLHFWRTLLELEVKIFCGKANQCSTLSIHSSISFHFLFTYYFTESQLGFWATSLRNTKLVHKKQQLLKRAWILRNRWWWWSIQTNQCIIHTLWVSTSLKNVEQKLFETAFKEVTIILSSCRASKEICFNQMNLWVQMI